MIYSLFLYKYQVQNTANAAPRHVYDTSAAPSAHRKRRAVARQQEYSRLRSRRKKKRKEKSAFSAALDARRRCEIGRWANAHCTRMIRVQSRRLANSAAKGAC